MKNHSAMGPRSSSLACLECRRKHLRCDAAYPTCRRCGTARLPCYYTPSRRGRRRRPETTPASLPSDTDGSSQAVDSVPTVPDEQPDLLGSLHLGFDSLYTFQQPFAADADAVAVDVEEAGDDSGCSCVDDEALIHLYYAFFHRAHPFLVPRHLYHRQRYPAYLRLAVQFVGSHYAGPAADSLRDVTGRALADSSSRPRRTVAMVQALMLFAVALHARHELAACDAALARAVALALELGLHRRAGAGAGHHLSAVEAESRRRTWWELYVIDGYLAALHHKSSFVTAAVASDVGLPCEEAVYAAAAGFPAEPPSLAQFDARLFAAESEEGERPGEQPPFSSFCYRIDAVRLLGRVLTVSRGVGESFLPSTAAEAAAVDHALVGWAHHLHHSKREIVGSACSGGGATDELDEMLFQAHMIVQYATMVLHCPRSDLVQTLPSAAQISCGRREVGGCRHDDTDGDVPASATRHAHAAQAMHAAARLSGLAALRGPVRQHTPFFACALLLSATVQLAACASRPALSRPFRDSVVLVIGVLRSLSQTWPLAHNALRLLREVASEVLQQSSVVTEHAGRVEEAAAAMSGLDGQPTLMPPEPWVLPLMLEFDA